MEEEEGRKANMNLEKEDYVEPTCALCGKPGEEAPREPVPVDRILTKLREYEDRNDWPAVEKHLLYWMAEARQNRDDRGRLTLHNELMGYYRKQGKKTEALDHAQQALELVRTLGMEKTVTAGTTWVNAGTVKEAFGDPAGALDCFERAKSNYESSLPPGDSRMGGLYNNMALALAACGRYEESMTMFRKALEVMTMQENGELEQAITWLNMADTMEAKMGPEASEMWTEECLNRAMELLDTDTLPRNGYYAFVCEKCAPVFGHYGHFAREEELNRRAREITSGQK